MNRPLPLAALALCALLAACAPLTPPPAGEKIIRDVPYKVASGRTLRLDVYEPKGAGPHPLVLWIHGGGWKYGDKGWMLYLRRLTRYGYAVASVEYRLSGRAKYPAQYEDCRDALHFLERHEREYQIDGCHVFLAGASAGGHLAALLGLKETRAHVAGVVAMYPATDLNGFENQGATRGYLPEVLGGSVSVKRALAIEGSPVTYVSGEAPPFLFIHGDQDRLVPLDQSQRLHRKLRAAGVESTLTVVPGAGHGFGLTDEQLAQVAAFLHRHCRH
jgi:acetyl esterase/lipase